MGHPAAVLDYSAWILQALTTLLLSLLLLRKMKQLNVYQGLIKVLVLLMIAESVCTLVFEFTFAIGSKTSTFNILITSVMIGGEVSFKGFQLCLFAFRYLEASYESPQYVIQPKGGKKLQFLNPQSLQSIKQKSEITKRVFLLFLALNWLLITVGDYLFTSKGYFKSSQYVQSLYNTQMITTALMFITISAVLGYAVRKIWVSLRLIPDLQRNQKIMWLHFTVVILYSFFFISAAVIVSMAINQTYPIKPLLIALNVQGIFQAVASLIANIALLYILNRFTMQLCADQSQDRGKS